LTGTTSFPDTLGTPDLDAFTFGTTPLTTPFATVAPSQPSLAADVAARPADKGDKGVAGKVPVGGDCLIGMAVCKGPLALLPGITNPVFFDGGAPGPVRDAVWRAMATYNKETVLGFSQTQDRENATVVVKMQPFHDLNKAATTTCQQLTWYLSCAQKAISFNSTVQVDFLPAPPSPVDLGCDRSDLSCRKEEADQRAVLNRDNQRENADKAAKLYSTAMHELGHVVGLGHTDDPRSIMSTNHDWSERWPPELLPAEIKAINQAYSRYLTVPTPRPQPVPRPPGFR
ncbi:MAG TPA: matrixin family metalloprotease, partial [Frankiaceae bacterium]|nr:matrixin family metalloprotease [Frankiaceae bacterium]